MGREVRVSIIGESILVEGIMVGLENIPLVTMQRIHADDEDTLQLISNFKPDILISPLVLPGIIELLSIIKLLPGLRLVGLDIECNQVLIIDCHMHHSLSMDEFQKLIASQNQDWFEQIENELADQQATELEMAA